MIREKVQARFTKRLLAISREGSFPLFWFENMSTFNTRSIWIDVRAAVTTSALTLLACACASTSPTNRHGDCAFDVRYMVPDAFRNDPGVSDVDTFRFGRRLLSPPLDIHVAFKDLSVGQILVEGHWCIYYQLDPRNVEALRTAAAEYNGVFLCLAGKPVFYCGDSVVFGSGSSLESWSSREAAEHALELLCPH